MTPTKLAYAGAAIATLSLTIGCNIQFNIGERLVGSGVSVTETREVDSFTKIEVGGALKLKAKIGENQSVTVSGDDNIVPVITTRVHNGTLKIQSEHIGSLNPKKPLTITIVAVELVAADISGACDIEVTGLAGADFDVELSGASKLTLNGDCERLTADISGASTFDGTSLKAKNANVDVSGASTARVHASESIAGEASGASNLRYSGNPAKAEINSSGASTAQAE